MRHERRESTARANNEATDCGVATAQQLRQGAQDFSALPPLPPPPQLLAISNRCPPSLLVFLRSLPLFPSVFCARCPPSLVFLCTRCLPPSLKLLPFLLHFCPVLHPLSPTPLTEGGRGAARAKAERLRGRGKGDRKCQNRGGGKACAK